VRVCKNPKCGKSFRLRRPSRYRKYCYRPSCEERKVWREQNFRRYKFLRRRWSKRHGKRYNRKYRLEHYGHTEESFKEQRRSQKNRCAICKRLFRGMPHIDHKFGTKKKHRGLLCVNCNTMIGHARERGETLLAAFDYLKKWEGK
jgi:hypothetical protein